MAKIIRREWMSKGLVGKRVRHMAFGYTLAIHGNRERKTSSAWTCEEDALKALSARQQQIRAGQTDRPEVGLSGSRAGHRTAEAPTGRTRFLGKEEIERLLLACAQSRNRLRP